MIVILASLINTIANLIIGLGVAHLLGPDQFGRFALALLIAITLQSATFEWIRLSTARLYSERVRLEQGDLRATLDLAFWSIAGGLVVMGAALLTLGIVFDAERSIIVAAGAMALTNGLFDYRIALSRARFRDEIYARMLLIKNGLSLVVTLLFAFLFQSGSAGVAALVVSMVGSLALTWLPLRDPNTGRARLTLAKQCLGYSMPIVASGLLYLLISLGNRAVVTHFHGYGETGQFSLAFDIGQRVIGAIGLALDILLFQMAVRADEQDGREAASVQVQRNITALLAVLAPACLGLWLVLPSLKTTLISNDYREVFGDYFVILLPGFFFAGLSIFGLNQIFQITHRTWPMIAAALAGVVANIVLIFVLPHQTHAQAIALAQSGSSFVCFLVLVAFAYRQKAKGPKWQDCATIALACAAMVVSGLPLREFAPGLVLMALQIVSGVIVYATCLLVFNIGDMRMHLRMQWNARKFTNT